MKHILPFLLAVFSTSLFAQVELYSPVSPSTGASTAQDFEAAYDIYDAQGADDFIVPSGVTWYLDSIVLPGTYSPTAATTCGIQFSIHTDNSGEPGTVIFGDTVNSDLDGNGDGDITYVFSTPLAVSSGHYWLVANGRKNFAGGGGQWYWVRDVNSTGHPGLWRNPGNGFGSGCTAWVPMYNCAALSIPDSGWAMTLYGCYGPIKPVGTGFDTLLCAGAFNSVTLTGDTMGSQANVTYQWSTGATTQSITVTGSGTYTLWAVDSITQCGRVASYNVGIGSVPEPEIDDDTLCGSSSIPATWGPIGGCQDCETSWSDGSTGSFFSSFSDGWVVVTVTDTVSGCFSVDSAYLTVLSAEATIDPGSVIDLCEGTTTTVSVQETLNNYVWAFTSDGSNWSSLGSSATAEVSEGGFVAISGFDQNGCEVFDTAQVIEHPAPNPTITATSQSNGDVKLKASDGFATYLWSDGGVGQTNTVSQNGIYTVTVTDEFGCEGVTFYNVFNVGVADPISSQLTMYPNPANDQITIEWPAEWVGEASATVFDVQGRTLTQFSATKQVQTIDLGALAAGHYVMQIQSPEGLGKTSLIITR
ncbi:MAG: T9SS type A sorting domain-containing protein [Cryomorphaceae bacterium]